MFTGSCATLGGSTNGSDDIVIEDSDFEKIGVPGEEEITLFDSDFDEKKGDDRIESEKREGKKRESNDNSTIQTSFDGAGNKVETREFSKNPLVKKVVVRTGVDGRVKIFVYAHNGKVKHLSKQEYERVLTAPGNEVASAAKIYESREDRDRKRDEALKSKNEQIRVEKERIAAESAPSPENRPIEPEATQASEPNQDRESDDQKKPVDEDETN